MRKYGNHILIGFGLTIIIYVGLALVLDNGGKITGEVVTHLRTFPLYSLVIVTLAQTIVGVLRFVEWHYYLGVIGARDKISLFDNVVLFVSGGMLAVSPGKAAEVLVAVVLKGKTGVPVARSAPVVIAERVIDGMAVIVVLLLAVMLAPDGVDLAPYRPLVLTSVGLLTFGLVAVQIRPLAYFCLDLVGRVPVVGRLQPALVEFYESSHEIFRLRHVILMLIPGMGVYIFSSLGFLFVLHGLGLDITWQLFLQVTFITGVASAVGALSFVPNGAGITEVSNSAMLMALVAPQNALLTEGAAVTAAVIQGFFHKWFRVVVGMIVAVIFRKRLLPDTFEADLAEMEAERSRRREARHPESASAGVTPD